MKPRYVASEFVMMCLCPDGNPRHLKYPFNIDGDVQTSVIVRKLHLQGVTSHRGFGIHKRKLAPNSRM